MALLVCQPNGWSAPSASGQLSGLKQTLQDAEGGHAPDSRRSRLAALFLPESAAPSPFLPPGRFISVWEGYLNLKLNDSFVFSVEGRGEVTVEFNGKPVLQTRGPSLAGAKSGEIDLKKGPNAIRITYQSPASGDAQFRLYWWNPHQPREPVPPEAFTCDATDLELVRGQARRLGRRLFATGRCIRCHLPDIPLPSDAMPEMAADSPDLTGIGDRLNTPWLAQWLSDPHSVRLNAQMPAMLHGTNAARSRQAADIAAFLATLHQHPNPSDGQEDFKRDLDLIDAGAIRFEDLGCLTCHTLPGDTPWEHEPRMSLAHVRAKWKPAALARFLENPRARYQWSRMPDFQLTETEARELAAFVWDAAEPATLPPAPDPDPVRGRELVRDLGCLNCHKIDGLETQLNAPTLDQISAGSSLQGCLAPPTPEGRSPNYGFTEPDRRALAAFMAGDLPSLNRRCWAEYAERQFNELQCIACHARESESDRWSILMADQIDASFEDFEEPATMEGDLEDDFFDAFEDGESENPAAPGENNIHQLRPPLTLAGEKLHPEWTEALIAGRLPYKPRPRLKARMPVFPVHARGLALGLSLQHGFSPVPETLPPPDPHLAEIGRSLIQMDRFGCVSCHAVGDAGALSGPSSEAINFSHAFERLRKHYFDRYVQDPQRTLPGTMMPKYLDDQFQSSVKDVMGGDAKRQFEAIWQYLQSLAQE